MKDNTLAALRNTLTRRNLSPPHTPTPAEATFDDFIPHILATESAAQQECYGAYWRLLLTEWGPRRLADPTPTEILQPMNRYKAEAVIRSNWRGGTAATRNLLHGIRRLYRLAELDGLITPAANPATKVPMPPKLESTRHALTPHQVAELGRIAIETGNDPELDALIVRLRIETACRRHAALTLRVDDLSEDDCTVLLHHKGGVDAWHPITPLLMTRLLDHVAHRGAATAPALDHGPVPLRAR
ncbi:hypothetical protein [Nocardia rhamnosiphila]|uniref:Integrase n=1 Tax=Nocardia rhamnosiphila TaxID=426716 RepID=A0ABV2WXQ5_9NOCA